MSKAIVWMNSKIKVSIFFLLPYFRIWQNASGGSETWFCWLFSVLSFEASVFGEGGGGDKLEEEKRRGILCFSFGVSYFCSGRRRRQQQWPKSRRKRLLSEKKSLFLEWMPQKKYERHQMFFCYLGKIGEWESFASPHNIVLVSCALERGGGKREWLWLMVQKELFLDSPIIQRFRFGQKQN